MIEAVNSLLSRYGTSCTVSNVTTSRNELTGEINTETTVYTGKAYRKASIKSATGLNPSVKAVLVVAMNDGYIIKTKDLITHGTFTNQQVLNVQLVNPLEGVAYQLVEV